MCISKRIMWIISKRLVIFFLLIFVIPSLSRHEKRCRMLVRLFSLFQCSRNPQCFSISLKNWSNDSIHVMNLPISRVFCNYFIGQKLCIKASLNRKKKLHYFPAVAFSAAAAAFFSCFSLMIFASRSFRC